MGNSYTAVFLLPTPVVKCLTDIGWEFESTARLPDRIIAILGTAFAMRSTESYLGMDVFEGAGVKAIFSRDDAGEIENIFLQVRGRKPDEFRKLLDSADLGNIEVFVPAE